VENYAKRGKGCAQKVFYCSIILDLKAVQQRYQGNLHLDGKEYIATIYSRQLIRRMRRFILFFLEHLFEDIYWGSQPGCSLPAPRIASRSQVVLPVLCGLALRNGKIV
jgi:hypothetical protein